MHSQEVRMALVNLVRAAGVPSGLSAGTAEPRKKSSTVTISSRGRLAAAVIRSRQRARTSTASMLSVATAAS